MLPVHKMEISSQIFCDLIFNPHQTIIGKGISGEIQVVKKIGDKINKGTTILSRRNASLFEIAIEALADNKKVHFAGGISKYDLELLTAIANLELGKVITHQFVRNFNSLHGIEEYAENAGESDITMFVKLVKQNTGRGVLAALKRLVELDEWVLANPAINIVACDYLLTTAHRSKGLEFDEVVIVDDFTEFYQFIEDNVRGDYFAGGLSNQSAIYYEQEVNLYYVAVTRARKLLLLVDSPLTTFLAEDADPEI